MVSVNFITVSGNITAGNGETFSDSYMVQAWNIFTQVLNFMKNTTILSIGGVNITFLGLACSIMAFTIIVELIQHIFYD